MDRVDSDPLDELERGRGADPREPGRRDVETPGAGGEPQRRAEVRLVHVLAREPAGGVGDDRVEPVGAHRHKGGSRGDMSHL